MIQCKDCQHYSVQGNSRRFTCNPFENIVEPECLVKWQVMKLDMLLSTQQALYQNNAKLAPLQDKLMKYVEREIDDLDDADDWKYDNYDEYDDDYDDEDDEGDDEDDDDFTDDESFKF